MRYEADWDLSTIPDEIMSSEWGRRRAAKRKTRGGPPRKPTPCPRCGVTCPTAKDARMHCVRIYPSARLSASVKI